MNDAQFYPALGVIWVFGFAAVLLVAWHLRNKRRLEKLKLIHEERMKAMEKGIPLPEFPELDDHSGAGGAVSTALTSAVDRALASHAKPWNPRWPLGAGAVLVMAGIGTSVAMRLSAWELHNDLWAFGLIGVFVGVGLFLYYGLTRSPRDEG